MTESQQFINEFITQACLYGRSIMENNADDAARAYAALVSLIERMHPTRVDDLSTFAFLLDHENDFVRFWSVSLLDAVLPKECEQVLSDLSRKPGPIGSAAKLNLERFEKRLEYSLVAVVDQGAVQWKIGTVEKYCSVFAAKAFIERYGLVQVTFSHGNFLIDRLAEVKDRLRTHRVEPPSQFNLQFLFKTCETFLWFAAQHNITKKQLWACIHFAERHYEHQVIEQYG